MVTTPEPQLDEYGFNYYPVLVKVQCGLTSGRARRKELF